MPGYSRVMEWMTLAGTVAGAIIAMVSTLLVERRRDRRELEIDRERHYRQMQIEWQAIRKQLYSEYLVMLTQARNEIRRIALEEKKSIRQRAQEARAAFLPCYGLRYQMEILAPEQVASVAVELFRKVRNMRDSLADGPDDIASETSQLTDEYHEALRNLRSVMRADLAFESSRA